MEFGGKITINVQASAEKIWETFLNDTNILCAVVPGGETVEKVDDKTWHVIMKQGLGPFKFKFDMTAVLTAMEAPKHAEIEGEGQDVTKLGNFKMKMTLDLNDIGDSKMEIAYTINAVVGGKLGSFGDRILNAKTKSMEKEIAKNMEKALSSIS